MRAARLTLADRASAVKLALRDPAVLGLDGLHRTGWGWMARSPWRDERTASCSIRDMADGLAFHDFGGDQGGDVLNVIAVLHGLGTSGRDFARLVELGEQLAGIVPGETPLPPARPKPTPKTDDSEERYAVQARIADVLLDVAPLGDEGRAYLRVRGFHDDEIPGDWCLLPPPDEQRRLIDAIIAEIGRDAWCELSGLATRDGRSFAHPHARLVIPWRAAPGVQADVAYLQRRRLDGEKISKYVGPAGIRAPWPFGIEDFEIDGEGVTLVLVEGALDVLAMRALARTHGLDRIALGIPGAKNWRREWAALGAGRDVIVALDGDDAGNGEIGNIALDLSDAGARDVSSEAPMHGKDWSDTLAHARGGKVAA